MTLRFLSRKPHFLRFNFGVSSRVLLILYRFIRRLPVQWFNFQFISPDLRVVFIGVTTFIWLNVLCFIKSVPLTDFAAVSSVTQAKTTVQSKIVAAKGGAGETTFKPFFYS